jgi:O-antigen/teichoic acid export membrane protein
MTRKSHNSALQDVSAIILLLLLPLLLFAPVGLGHRTLLPVDALFLFEPYLAASDALGVTFPHNHLVTDLILENYAWKRFLLESIHDRQLPLWDPYIFAGHPFLANGQHSALYPLSVVFYILPLWRAYGVFAWLQLGLAGTFAYLFARVVGVRRIGGLVAGITFQFCGFMAVSAVPHPMIIAAASWLPFILAMIELIIQQRPLLGQRPATLPWTLLGALGLGCQMLAGHVENTYFTLLVTGVYTLWRLLTQPTERYSNKQKKTSRLTSWWISSHRAISWLAVMLTLGLALGAIQFVPYYEVVVSSFRGGEAAASLAQVRDWAYPPRRLITFGIPNFFGGPAHHGYLDLFSWHWTPAMTFPDGRYIDWGIKNYVEGGAYLGLVPLFLALVAILKPSGSQAAGAGSGNPKIRGLATWFQHPHIPFFTLLSLFSLGCIFGTPVYALVYALPGLEQSHSPFRWVFPLSLSVAMLAGFGIEAVTRSRDRLLNGQGAKAREHDTVRNSRSRLSSLKSGFLGMALLGSSFSLVTLVAGLAFWGGIATLGGLILSRIGFVHIEPLVEQVFLSLAKAPTAFPNHRAFYSFEFKWVTLFSLFLTGTGIVLRVSRCPIFVGRRPVWEFLVLGLLVLDLLSFSAGFGPAVNPALLDYTPPVIEFLKQDTSQWRYATFTPPGTTKTMNANVGMYYGLEEVAGYDSLFSRQYAGYMALIEEQDELQYNRIAPFSEWSSLDSPLTDLLNVKYVITEIEIPNPKYQLVYQDEAVLVYENLAVMPRSYTMPIQATLITDNLASTVQKQDPRNYVILESGSYPSTELRLGPLDAHAPQPETATGQKVTHYTINEVQVDAQADQPSWLILTDAYFPGWKAFVRPQGSGQDTERQITVHSVNGTFRGVLLPEPGAWTVRFKYSPDSVKIGAFISFIAGMMLLFLAGIYLWRFFYREEDDTSTVRRVAKNSIAPIVINVFNRAIEMAFAALAARILGPEGNGRYATAINIYLWFDIVANFGLDMYLMREVARRQDQARQVFINTTILRLLLFTAVMPVLGGFLTGWQALGEPLAAETVWAIILLYAGLLPGSLNYGLTALFRGWEKHEIPAVIQTMTTIVKVTLGVLVLVSGMGIVGLAGASIVTNLTTMITLALLAQRMIWSKLEPTRDRVVWPLLWTMLHESWPLMASLLLQALFTGLNLVLLQRLQDDTVVGWYDAARKWVDALNIIPSVFTFAVFPVMSRQAAQDRSGLQRSYRLSVKLLVLIALPASILITLLATTLIGVLSGKEFLPHGARVLQLLIWSILFGWINSLTNYVLIALDRQRYVLVASGVRVAFVVITNLLFVGTFSYFASAYIIVGGELLLVLLFYIDLRRQLGSVGWLHTLGRPIVAGLLMATAAWTVAPYSPAVAVFVSLAVYMVALVFLRALTPEEWQMLAPLLPARLRQMLPA